VWRTSCAKSTVLDRCAVPCGPFLAAKPCGGVVVRFYSRHAGWCRSSRAGGTGACRTEQGSTCSPCVVIATGARSRFNAPLGLGALSPLTPSPFRWRWGVVAIQTSARFDSDWCAMASAGPFPVKRYTSGSHVLGTQRNGR